MSETAAIEQAATYLAVFLPQARANELARGAVEEAGSDAERSAVLAAAHRRLTDEVRVTDEVAADVLVEEVGLTPQDAAQVLDVSDQAVLAAVDAARSVAQELGAAAASEPPVRYVFDTEGPEPGPPPELPPDEPAERSTGRRSLTLLVGLLVVIAIVLAVVQASGPTGDGPGADGPDGAGVAGPVRISDVRVTDRVSAEGPGPARGVFAPDDPVVFWFAYEPLEGEAVVELALARDGEQLIAPTFPLPRARTDSHVTLPRVVTEEPGSYRLELRRDGRVLAEAGFQVEAQ